ncbi:MAG TPA: hypothetical protein VF084_02365 [Nitrososphaeraceae archaeon]
MVRFADVERNSVPYILEDVINFLIKKKILSEDEINDIVSKYPK